MKFVVYLSGEDNQTIGWHRTHDTVAHSVAVPKSIVARVTELLVDSEMIDAPPPKSYKSSDVPLRMSPDALSDMFSDLGEDAEPDSDMAWLAREVEELCGCEALCGDVHLVVGRA